MTEYIKRDDVHLALDSHYFTGELSLRETIDSVPSADVVERKRGKWIKIRTHDGGVWKSIACSNCKYEPWFSSAEPFYSFCPNCGADMRGRKNDQDI